MKKIYLLFLTVSFYCVNIFAQTPNDDCATAYRLCAGSLNPGGKNTTGLTSNGTNTCFPNYADKFSAWFKVKAFKTDSSARIILSGIDKVCSPFGSGVGATITVFDGCGGILSPLEMAKTCDTVIALAFGGTGSVILTIDSTTAGKEYFIMVNTPDTCTTGEGFNLSIVNLNNEALMAPPNASFIDSFFYADILVNAQDTSFNTRTDDDGNGIKDDNFPIANCDTIYLAIKNTSVEHGGNVRYYWGLDAGFTGCADLDSFAWSGGCSPNAFSPTNIPGSKAGAILDPNDTTNFLHYMFFPPCKKYEIILQACNECHDDGSFNPPTNLCPPSNKYIKEVNSVRVEPSIEIFPDSMCVGPDCRTPLGFDLTATPNPPDLVDHYFNKFILTTWQLVCDTFRNQMIFDTTIFVFIRDTTISPDTLPFKYDNSPFLFPDTINRSGGWRTNQFSGPGDPYDTIYTMYGKLLQKDTIIVDTLDRTNPLLLNGTKTMGKDSVWFYTRPDGPDPDLNPDTTYFFIPQDDQIFTFLELFGADTFCVSRKLMCADTLTTVFNLRGPLVVNIFSDDTVRFCLDDDSIGVCVRVPQIGVSPPGLTPTNPIRYQWYLDSISTWSQIRNLLVSPSYPDTDCVDKGIFTSRADYFGNAVVGDTFVFHKKWFNQMGVFNRGDYQRLYPLIIEVTDAYGCCARDTAWIRICKPVIDSLYFSNFVASTDTCDLDDNGSSDNEKFCPAVSGASNPGGRADWYFVPSFATPANKAYCPADSIDLGFTVRAWPGIRLKYYRVDVAADTLISLRMDTDVYARPYSTAAGLPATNLGWDSVPPNNKPLLTIDNPNDCAGGPATINIKQSPPNNDSITVPDVIGLTDTIVDRRTPDRKEDSALAVYIKTPRDIFTTIAGRDTSIYGDTTDFIFALVAIDSFGCKDTAYLCVPIHEPPFVTLKNVCYGCPPDDSLFNVHGACEGSTYDWWRVDTTASPDTLMRDTLLKVLTSDSSFATYMYTELTDAQLIGTNFHFAVIVGDSGTTCRDTVLFNFRIDSLFRAIAPDTIQTCLDDTPIQIYAKVDRYTAGPMVGQLTGRGPFFYSWYVDSIKVTHQIDTTTTDLDSIFTIKDSVMLIYDLYAFHKKYAPNPPATYMDDLNIIVRVEDSRGCVCIDTTLLILCKPSIDTMRITNISGPGNQATPNCAVDDNGFTDNERVMGCIDPWYCMFSSCGPAGRAFCRDDSIGIMSTIRGRAGLKFVWYRVDTSATPDTLIVLVPDTEIFARPYSGAVEDLGWDTLLSTRGDSIHFPNSALDTVVYLRPRQSNVLSKIPGDSTDFMIALVAIDSFGCKDTAYLCVALHEPPYVVIDSQCLTAIPPDSIFKVRGACAGSTYRWYGVDTTVTPWVMSATQNPFITHVSLDSSYASFDYTAFPDTILRDSLFTFAVVVNDGVTRCMDTVLFTYKFGDILRVNIDTLTIGRITDTVICLGDPVTIYLDTLVSDTAGVTFVWTRLIQDSTTLDTMFITTIASDTFLITDLIDTTVIYVEAIRGGCSVMDSITIYVDSVPYATVIALPDDTVCKCSSIDNVTLTTSLINSDTSNFVYKWVHFNYGNSVSDSTKRTTSATICFTDSFILYIIDTLTGCGDTLLVGADTIKITAVDNPVSNNSDSIAHVINDIREALSPGILPFRVDSICAGGDSADVILSTLGSDSLVGTKYIWSINYDVGNGMTLDTFPFPILNDTTVLKGMYLLKWDSITAIPMPESFRNDTLRINKYTEFCLSIVSGAGFCDTTICDTIFEYDPICVKKTAVIDTFCDVSGLCKTDFTAAKDTINLCIDTVIDPARASFAWTFEPTMSSDAAGVVLGSANTPCVDVELDSATLFADAIPDTLVFRAVVVDSIKGCLDTLYHKVIVIDAPVLTLTKNPIIDSICAGDTIYYKASGYVVYTWSSVPPDATTNGDTIVYQNMVSFDSIMAVPTTFNNQDTSYIYTVVGIAGNCVDSLKDTVKVFVKPIVNIGGAAVRNDCQPDSVLIEPVLGANSDSVLWTVFGPSVAKGGFRFNYIRTNPLGNDSTWYIPADTFGRDTLILAVYKNNPICSAPFFDTVIINIDTLPVSNVTLMGDTIYQCQNDSPIITYNFTGGNANWVLLNAGTTSLDFTVDKSSPADSVRVNIDPNATSGFITIKLIVNDPNPPVCQQARDSIRIKVFKIANVLPGVGGALIDICQGECTPVLVNQVSLVADSIKFKLLPGLLGSFVPNDTTRTAVFCPADTFGNYTIRVYAFTDSCSMVVDSADIIVNVTPKPIALMTVPPSETICISETYMIRFSYSGGDTAFTMTGGGTLNPNVNITAPFDSILFTPSGVGQTKITLTVFDPTTVCSKDSVDTIRIVVLADPTVSISGPANNIICENDAVQITVTASNYTDTLVWAMGGGHGTLTKVTNLSYVYTGTTQGLDSVWVIANNTACNNTSDIAKINFNINPDPLVRIKASTLVACGGISPVVVWDSLNSATTYIWVKRNRITGVVDTIIKNTTQDTITDFPDTNATYILTGLLGNGCFDVDSVQVDVEPNPVPMFDAGSKDGDCYPLSAEFVYQGDVTGLDSLIWDFGDGEDSVVTSGFKNPIKHYFRVPDSAKNIRITFYVRLRAVYDNDCYRDSIFARESCVDFYIPNVFTPDGDGKNDRFVIRGIYDKNCDLQIFNRWGEKIWEGKYPLNPEPGWDGRDKDNNLVNTDTYYFILKCSDKSTYTGWVKVIRQQ